MKIVSAQEMRRIEAECDKQGITSVMLMENAGRAVAEAVRHILGHVSGKKIVVLAGPGNNGGDGLVAARYLHDWGAGVGLYLCAQRPADDSNLKLALERSIALIEAEKDENLAGLDSLLNPAEAVIDAVFGTGQSRPISGIYQRVLTRVAEVKRARPTLKVVALDLPSGLNADSGAADPVTLFADYTVTLGLPKRGLYTPSGAGRAGEVVLADIGIPPELTHNLTTELITSAWARSVLPRRSVVAHKGSFGKVLVVAGSINYVGAAYLAASGAMRVGAGLVTLATARSLQPILASKLVETTYLPLPEAAPGIIASSASRMVLAALKDYDVLLMGSGLGPSVPVKEFILRVLSGMKEPAGMVLDADVLNTLAGKSNWWQRLPFDAILTPHPGEMARLCRLTAEEVQADRIGLALKKAAEWGKTVVLKGAYTVIAAPDGRCRVSPAANAGLASAGTGDVLAGIISGLLAQGMSLFDAASLGVYLQAEAAEAVRNRLGDAGMIASDLLPELPLVIKGLKEGKVSL